MYFAQKAVPSPYVSYKIWCGGGGVDDSINIILGRRQNLGGYHLKGPSHE